MEGFCYYLAVALHYEFGFNLGFAGYTTNTGLGIYHAWAVLPDGKCLDIEGKKTLEEILHLYKWENKNKIVVSSPCSLTEFKYLMSPLQEHFRPDYFEVVSALNAALEHIPALKQYTKRPNHLMMVA